MLKIVGFLIVVQLLNGIHSFELTSINSDLILAQFTKFGSVNTIKLEPNKTPDPSTERKRTFNAYFEEQCALECLKNLNCLRYSFSVQVCEIYLKPDLVRQIDPASVSQLSQNLKCKIDSCDKSLYCSSANANGVCLCPIRTSLNNGACKEREKYELSEWSEWSMCSTSCDQGFRERSRKCLRKYFNSILNSNMVEEVSNNDWLCGSNQSLTKSVEKHQIEACNLKVCKTYGEWSAWSTCSKICGGTSIRKRECLDSTKCDMRFLNQTKTCGLNDCQSTNIILLRTENNPSANITKKGYLKLANNLINKEIRLFTKTDDSSWLEKVGKVACREFGFSDFNSVNAIKSDSSLRNLFQSDSDYLKFLNVDSLSGLACNGDERTIKDCQASCDSTLTNSIYELEVECLFDGYWSTWDPWTNCNVKCGAGAQRRGRTCTDPPPSVSGSRNGTNCPDYLTKNKEVVSCAMPRCDTMMRNLKINP